MSDPLIGLAGFLIGKAGYYVSKAFEDSAKTTVKQLWADAGAQLSAGTLPPNHHLDRALQLSLGQTARFLAHCLHEPGRKPLLDLLENFSTWPDWLHRAGEATQGNIFPRTEDDQWLHELIEATRHADAFKGFDTRLAVADPARLTREHLDEELSRLIPEEFIKWTHGHVTIHPRRPAGFDDAVRSGWVYPPAKPEAKPPKPAGRVTFYAVFCAFFREELKGNDKVFRAFQIHFTTQIDTKLDQLLAAQPSPQAATGLREEASRLRGLSAEEFAEQLDRANHDLLGSLLPEFQKLHERHDRHDRNLEELKAVVEALTTALKEKGLTPADLTQAELESELALRVPNLTPEGLHRLIGYARFKADISRILKYAPAELIGRETELKLLDDAWDKAVRDETHRPRILTYVALGGEGKTSLIAKWAAGLSDNKWPGCDAVFAWSFYSQGTREQTAVSSDLFLAEALTFFGDAAMAGSAQGAFEKGRRLAQLVGERRALLILDGLEPLQYAPTSPTPGELKDQGLGVLLKGLAATSHGLCVVTTRYAVPELRTFIGKTVVEENLPRLSRKAGVDLLKKLGVKGSELRSLPLTEGDPESEKVNEFEKLVEDVKGHALTLTLLGSYLHEAHGGDIRKRDQVKFEEADDEIEVIQGHPRHAFHVMDAYGEWFETGGKTEAENEKGRRSLALLRLMGLFDRPATADCLKELWKAPAITGLTEPLVRMSDAQRNIALTKLEAARLLTVNRDASGTVVSLDAHPHIREYFARELRTAPELRAPTGQDKPAQGNALGSE